MICIPLSCFCFPPTSLSPQTDVPRGYSTQELSTILFQMRRSGYAKVQQALKGMGAQSADTDPSIHLM